MVQIQRIAFYIVPSGHILKSHHGTMHRLKASTLRNEVQPPIQPLVPALIIDVALVVVSYEPEHDVNTVRVPSWRGAHSNLAQLAQRVSLGLSCCLLWQEVAAEVHYYFVFVRSWSP